MSEVQLPLLRSSFPVRNYDGLLKRLIHVVVAIIFLTVAHFLNMNIIIAVIVMFILIIATSRSSRRAMPDWATKKDVCGTITLSLEEIVILKTDAHERCSFTISGLRSVTIISNMYQGYQSDHRDIVLNGVCELAVKTSNGNGEEYKMLIAEKSKYEQFRGIAMQWHSSGMPVKEYFTHKKLRASGLAPA